MKNCRNVIALYTTAPALAARLISEAAGQSPSFEKKHAHPSAPLSHGRFLAALEFVQAFTAAIREPSSRAILVGDHP